jgi:hypothetical protein
MAQYQDPQTCEVCGKVAKRLISAPGFILKGDGWAGKNIKINGQMAKKNERVSAKQKERARDAPGISLVPNVSGERVESWSDAQKLAGSQGKSTASYDAKVRSEQGKR